MRLLNTLTLALALGFVAAAVATVAQPEWRDAPIKPGDWGLGIALAVLLLRLPWEAKRVQLSPDQPVSRDQ